MECSAKHKYLHLTFCCFHGYNGFRKDYSTKISNVHKQLCTPIPNGTAKCINENFVDSYPRNLCSMKLMRYTVHGYLTGVVVPESQLWQHLLWEGCIINFSTEIDYSP